VNGAVRLALAAAAMLASTRPLAADAGSVDLPLEILAEPAPQGAPPWQGRFVPTPGPLSLGVGAPPVWVRFRLENPSAEERRYGLSWDFPLVERLDLYVLEDGGAAPRARGGLALPTRERTFELRGDRHVASLALPPGARLTGLVRAETQGAAFVGLSAWDERELEARGRRTLVLYGVGVGLALLLAALGLVLSAAWRDPTCLLYALFVVSYAAYAATMSGFGAMALWPGHARFSFIAQPLFSGVTGFFGALFIRTALETRSRNRPLDRFLGPVAAANLGAGLLAFRHVPAANAFTAAMAAVTLVLGLYESGRSLLAGWRRARWYVAGFGAFSAFGTLFALSVLGVVRPHPALLWWGLQGGFAATSLALALALAERKLGESDDRFRVAFETSPDCIAVNRLADGVYLMINPGFTRVTGYTAEEIMGRSSLELSIWANPEDRVRVVAEVRRAGFATNLELRFRFKDGRIGVGLMSARTIRLRGQECLLTVTREISELKAAERERGRLQEELQQAQKMEALGRLAGGVAHDFNNLLSVILTNANMSLVELPPEDPSRESFQEIKDAASRAAELTRRLLAFGRRQVFEPRPLDLSAQVDGLETMMRRLLGEDLELVFELDRALPPIMADRGQVEQVIMNLALNAREAMRYGGKITIATRTERKAPPGGEGRAPSTCCVLSVRDTGPGMPEEVRRRVFEPFFTTKQGGTGLGLAIVHGVARQHGGFVEVDSAPSLGTTFRVFFPAEAQAANRGDPAPSPSARAAP
jgi:PAS domain S-box-containing protein